VRLEGGVHEAVRRVRFVVIGHVVAQRRDMWVGTVRHQRISVSTGDGCEKDGTTNGGCG
jgi:hypothetical protein